MLRKLKHFFSRKQAESNGSDPGFAYDHFCWLDPVKSLQKGRRRFVDEKGFYQDDGAITELEFLDGPAEFEFLMIFKNEEEGNYCDLLASLNAIDNVIQTILEKGSQQDMPDHLKELGYSLARWQRSFVFHHGYWLVMRSHRHCAMSQMVSMMSLRSTLHK